MSKVYSNNNIAVEWKPDLCSHCANCISGLPSVFDLSKRPWVNVEGASVEDIRKQLAECPTGAISERSL